MVIWSLISAKAPSRLSNPSPVYVQEPGTRGPPSGGADDESHGIGGIFFNAKAPVALRAWYVTNLGIDVLEWGGAVFHWPDEAGRPTPGDRRHGRHHFAPSTSSFMINYRVADLQGALEALRSEG